MRFIRNLHQGLHTTLILHGYHHAYAGAAIETTSATFSPVWTVFAIQVMSGFSVSLWKDNVSI